MGISLSYTINPIGTMLSPFKQKFAIPRQSQALSVAKGEIEFTDMVDPAQALDGIEDFSHLWLIFLFHENLEQGYSNKVRPPRLGGNKKIGVFASRSTFRPNGIGMSLVTNLGMHKKRLRVGGIDLLDGTPIIDIKPYLPYADIQDNATAGYASETPKTSLRVEFSSQALPQMALFKQQHDEFDALLVNVLSQDPRPAYKSKGTASDDKIYHVTLYNADIHWQVINNTVWVQNISTVV